jgi:hypothetical protein
MKEQAELAQAKYELDRMDNVAYDLHCNLEIAIETLNVLKEQLGNMPITPYTIKAQEVIEQALDTILDTKQTQA